MLPSDLLIMTHSDSF